MYIYNLTSVVSIEVQKQWLDWLKNEYALSIKNKGQIDEIRVFKILNLEQEHTYAIHHHTSSPQNLMSFIQEDIPKLQAECFRKFSDKVLMFGTELKEIEL
ncbi:DUF4286 family protein [Capnocytophaga canimorsus]|uniref:DUF4286 family protein n=1 Tax=Capnocytophaga canimorsus TaxID=28188 RepID=UPI0037CDA8B8